MKQYALAAIVGAGFVLGGCAEYRAGDCLQHVQSGDVWRVTRSSGADGYSAQGWFDGKWGVVIRGPGFDSDSYVKIECPFTTHMTKPDRTPARE